MKFNNFISRWYRRRKGLFPVKYTIEETTEIWCGISEKEIKEMILEELKEKGK